MGSKKYLPRVERIEGMTKLWVPHGDGEIAFAYPFAGKGNYAGVGGIILGNGQQVPTGDYTASLLHSVYCSKDVANVHEFQEVKKLLKDSWFWMFNRVLWIYEGVCVIRDQGVIGRSQPPNIRNLEKIISGGKEINGVIFSEDGKVRFAPKETYKLGYATPKEFAKNGFIIASCGEEGAEKLGEVAKTFSKRSIIYGTIIKKGQTPEIRVSSVADHWGDVRLYFGGYSRDDDYGGRAFGVLR